jgi:phosphotransferase system  glucose/maltose/N-acetylglucosamine-specific IIC component
MELLFITLGGVILGLIARYALPNRDRHGVVVVPAIGAAVAAVVWGILTWAGLPWDGGWIWVISLVVTAVAVVVADVLIGRRRKERDEVRLQQLLTGRVAA